MPFNPIHFEPSENGFLLVFKPSSLVINKPEYLLTCRGLLEDELKDKGYEMTDGATAVDGSDAQVWFEYVDSNANLSDGPSRDGVQCLLCKKLGIPVHQYI